MSDSLIIICQEVNETVLETAQYIRMFCIFNIIIIIDLIG